MPTTIHTEEHSQIADGPRLRLTRELMDGFATATGLSGGARPRRYLWTDAFAVCNFLGLHRATGEGRYLDLALRLVDQVHHELGRHRPDSRQQGWLSGLAEGEGERHPTSGGLRIGKPLPERAPNEPNDAQLEWDRDGQYFHYLTQWMHALQRVAEETGQTVFHGWAVELARVAHRAFVHGGETSAPRHMVWKMSVALDRVLVPSTGQHDPLDAWLAYSELNTPVPSASGPDQSSLDREVAEAMELCCHARWTTEDPLGTGALLVALWRLEQLRQRQFEVNSRFSTEIVAATAVSVEAVVASGFTQLPASHRLAFRELGFAIGLEAFSRLYGHREPRVDAHADRALDAVTRHLGLAREISVFWSDPSRRQAPLWRSHGDLNDVMLATALDPVGYLGGSRNSTERS